MRRIGMLCALALTAVTLAVGITFVITPDTVVTAPETAVSGAVPPSPAVTAETPVHGGATPSEAVEERVPNHLVIGNIRRFDWRPGTLTPPDFDNVFEVLSDDPLDGYSGGPETLRLMLAHATSEGNPRGSSPGNAWLTLQLGDTVSVPEGEFAVTEVWDAHKSDYPTQPPLATETFAEYNGALVLVTCVPRPPAADGSFRTATHNRWAVLRPIGEQ